MKILKRLAKMTGYDAVVKRFTGSRESFPVERTNENAILNANGRAYIIAAQRDAYRNTTFAPATALQLQTNVVGTAGGKISLSAAARGDEEAIKAERAFAKWASHCGFVDGCGLNEILRLGLTQLTHTGGDFIAVFDDGILTGGRGSGQLYIFESDEIANVSAADFEAEWGAGFTQENGLVYDGFGRIAGAFVSASARGKNEFAHGEYIALRLPVPGRLDSGNWTLVANRWRTNQGRGVSVLTHVTNLLQDLAETQSAEVQACKLNAGLGLVVKEGESAADLGHDWDDGAAPADDDERAAQAEVDAENAENAALRNYNNALAAGQAAIIKLTAGKSVESFKTDRPNLDTVKFILDQRSEAGTVFGMGQSYITLTPQTSYTAFRGEMVLFQRVVDFWRKKLEREFLDWLATLAFKWLGFEDADLSTAEWLWDPMPEIDQGAYQSALEKKFTNGLGTVREIAGTRWRGIAEQQAEEKAFYESRGLVYPALRTVSGQVIGKENGGVSDGQN